MDSYIYFWIDLLLEMHGWREQDMTFYFFMHVATIILNIDHLLSLFTSTPINQLLPLLFKQRLASSKVLNVFVSRQ